MKTAILFILFIGLLSGIPGLDAYSQTAARHDIISVSGEGIIKVEPDLVTVRFGVVTRDEDPVEARQLNEEAAGNALNAVRALGVEERKIQVTVLQLTEIQEFDRERRRQIPAGFQASRHIVVELDDLDTLPVLIAQVTQQGANRLSGISYDIKDREKAQNDALAKAADNARVKASVLARSLGVEIGRVVQIQEQSFLFPGPIPVRAMALEQMDAAMDMGRPDAYAAGEVEVRAQVQVEFSIK
jgi:uncharacterized protein